MIIFALRPLSKMVLISPIELNKDKIGKVKAGKTHPM